MAEVVRYVDPDASGGGTGLDWTNAYTSLSAMVTGEASDLATAGNWLHVYCRASAGTADTTTATINGFTTSADSYVLIEAADGDQAVKSGVDTSRYRIAVSSGSAVIIWDNHVRLSGLQISTTDGNEDGVVVANTAAGSDVRIDGCYIYGNTTGRYAIWSSDADTTLTITNSIIYQWNSRGINISGGVAHIYHTVSWNDSGCFGGIRNDGGTVDVVNCFCANNYEGYDIRDCDTVDHCASDDGTGTNAVAPASGDWDNEFVDPSNGDFTLLNTGNCYHGGVTGTGVATDIEGDAYDASTPSIGCDEYVAAGGIAIPVMMHHYAQMARN
jgi:hypothetical protein